MVNMTTNPLVSVITPFLNAKNFLAETIESVLAQTYDNWELLLIDDRSTDGTTEIALRYAKAYPSRIRYVHHAGHENKGQCASRNEGIRQSTGEYVAFLDHDDVWLPHKLEQQVAIMLSETRAGMVYGNTQYWRSWTGTPEDAAADYVPELSVPPGTLVEPPRLLLASHPLGTGSAPCTGSLLLRKAAVERVGGFEESFRGRYMLYEDQAFLVKVYLREFVFVAGECWDKYRLHQDSAMAVVMRAGHHDEARLFFLNWFERYLIDQEIRDADVWKALNAALRPYRHPTLDRVLRGARRFGDRMNRLRHAMGSRSASSGVHH